MTAADRSPIRVVGRYALYNEIAAGGMATIHLGRLLGPVGFARTVAVKRLHPQFAKDPEFVSMFLDEARLAARVQHPNVVATIDVVANEGELFLIMDYVRGESLSKIIRTLRKQKQLVPPRIAAAIMCGFLHGLHAAHEAKNERGEPLGLVHRDVSPQNVLVGSDGIARVLDFGIAKAQGRLQVTRDGQIKGKLAYMPPEQVSGREITRAADIYASGVVMWEMLTSERLFKGATEAETLTKLLRDPIRPPSAILPDLEIFDAVLLKALSRDVSKRPATAKELALEIERCCGIASATAVGEWVERTVGGVLSAREEQIAEIESSSVGMNVPPDLFTDSDSDVSLPSLDAIRRAFESSSTTTLQMGSGQPIPGPSATAAARLTRPSPTVATSPHRLATPSPSAPRREAPLPRADAAEPGTESTSTNQGTGAQPLPFDGNLALLASMAGIVVLLIAIAVVLGGKFSTSASTPTSDSSSARAGSASASSSSTPTPPNGNHGAASAPATSEHVAEPPPAPPTTGEPVEGTKPTSETSGAGDPQAKPTSVGTGHPPPKASAAQSAPTPKTSCDPPYTIDATGRKKYKRECM